MVAYLKKPTGSEGFQEIVDFCNDSYIRYALTKNPTIYVSLIKKFWQTTTVKTVDNGEQETTAIVDGKEFTITKASVRRHLQLANVDGISVLPYTEIFAQLSLMGYVSTDDKLTFQKAEEGKGSGHPSEPQPPPFTAQPIHEEPILNVVSSSHQKTQTPRQALNQVTELPQASEPIPNVSDEAIYEEWDDIVERATTTVSSLDAEQASGNINKTQSMVMPNVSLPQGIDVGGSPRCQEAMGGSIAQTSMQLQELMALCTKLSDRVLALEIDLRQAKQVYGAAYTKLIMKVKKLEKIVKSNKARRRAKIVVSDNEEDS
ncbi:hypothetical protein Tco_0937949 [Tanacetum coccineum]|uniref:Xylulose kinase-1 n=1 Tax=Tanacetum coccineum TaxID=301880 RepID=A0ABQ5DLX9_9ASTR